METPSNTPRATDTIEQLSVNTIRTLSMDAVQAANSGHPGTPMALAPVAYKLWRDYLRFDPELPVWANRDRFVLSVGHASALLYSMLHLAGVKSVNPDYEIVGEPAVSLEDLRRFRQLDSKCPGHPEYRWTSGVECTTGPLGTGIATSVGMAIAGLWQAATFNRPGYELFDYDVYALCGDGCLMEGIGAEAASLAGHLKLSNLCWIYDNNKITIEGPTSLAFSEDVPARFAGYGWAVQHVSDANDLAALGAAFDAFRAETERPTMIVVDSIIGYGSPNKAGTHSAHGEPLGVEEVKATKRFYGWPEDETFLVPPEVADHVGGGMRERGGGLRRDWEALFARYAAEYPEQAEQLNHMQRRTLPEGWDADIPSFPADAKGVAGRDANAKVLNAVATAGAVAGRRLGRPGAVQQVPDDLRRGRRLLGHRPGRAQPALRRARARGRGRRQWTGAVQAARLPGRVLDLLRLPARRAAALRADGAAADPPLHPRLHRGRRGRADPPADRAPGLDPGHARRDRPAPGRRQRGGRGVAGADADPARAGGADAVPPAAAHPGPGNATPRRPGWRAGPTCWPTHPRASPR